MSYLVSQMMWRRNYPVDHEITQEKFEKLRRKIGYKNTTFEEYRDFLAGSDAKTEIMDEFELHGEDFVTRGQFVNWVVEKRLKDGRII